MEGFIATNVIIIFHENIHPLHIVDGAKLDDPGGTDFAEYDRPEIWASSRKHRCPCG